MEGMSAKLIYYQRPLLEVANSIFSPNPWPVFLLDTLLIHNSVMVLLESLRGILVPWLTRNGQQPAVEDFSSLEQAPAFAYTCVVCVKHNDQSFS